MAFPGMHGATYEPLSRSVEHAPHLKLGAEAKPPPPAMSIRYMISFCRAMTLEYADMVEEITGADMHLHHVGVVIYRNSVGTAVVVLEASAPIPGPRSGGLTVQNLPFAPSAFSWSRMY